MTRSIIATAACLAMASASCFERLDMMTNGTFGMEGKLAFGNLLLASAADLPYDAGKWVMCENTPGAKYHLLTVQATLPAPSEKNASGVFQHVMEYGLCLPDVCTAAEVQNMALVTTPLGMKFGVQFTPLLRLIAKVENPVSTSRDDMRGPDVKCWIAVAIMSLLTVIIAVSTAVTIQAKRRIGRETAVADGDAALLEGGEPARPKAGLEKNLLVSAFSLVGDNGTWDTLWAMPPYRPTDCLNGVRALSMMWVIVGHTFIMAQGIVGYQNPQDIQMTPLNKAAAETDWKFMFVLNAQMSVDTFFYMGGFLFSYLLVKVELKRSKFNHAMALLLRYLRLTPSLGLVMMVYYLILPFLASGPFAPRFQNSVFRRCDISWWSELLYTVNFLPVSGSDDVCMGWTWYLGDDMIFFIVGIILVPVYYQRKAVGWAAVTVMTLASLAVTIYLCLSKHLGPNALDYHYAEYSYWAYSKPYTRIPCYFVGVVAGWILVEMENRGINNKTGWLKSTWAQNALWLFAVGMTTFITFIPATDMGYMTNSWGDVVSMFYLTFSRPMWGLCWAIMTFLCYFGHAPLTNAFLSHRFWTPFARLTYGAYLCHPLIIKLSGANTVQYYTFGAMDEIYRWSGNCAMAFVASFFVWCYIERPMTTFTNTLLKSKKGNKAKEDKLAKMLPEDAQSNKPVAGK